MENIIIKEYMSADDKIVLAELKAEYEYGLNIQMPQYDLRDTFRAQGKDTAHVSNEIRRVADRLRYIDERILFISIPKLSGQGSKKLTMVRKRKYKTLSHIQRAEAIRRLMSGEKYETVSADMKCTMGCLHAILTKEKLKKPRANAVKPKS